MRVTYSPAGLLNNGNDLDGVETMPRHAISSANIVMTSGTLRLAYFTQPVDATITKIVVQGGTTAAGATPTLARFGLYTVASNGDITLVAATASDTALFAVANTEEPRDLSTGGGLPASYTLQRGIRYAFGGLVVTGAAAPTVRGNFNNIAATVGRSPRVATNVGGQTDLPTTFANGSLSAASSWMYVAGVA